MSIIVFPRGQLRPADRKRIEAAGLVVVEADDPKAVVTVVPGGAITSSNEMLMCALHAISGNNSSTERAAFTLELWRRLKAREEASAGGSGSGSGSD
jgi:hypothetical protein